MDPKLLQSVILVLAVVIITSAMLRRLALRQAPGRPPRRTGGGTEPSRRPSMIDGGETFAKAQEAILDLSSFIRELEAHLDTKARYLRGLIEEADRAGERLAAAVAEARGAADPGRSPRDPRRAEAERLADEGLDPDEIAARTGLPKGEAELLAGLRRSRRSLDPSAAGKARSDA